MADEEDEHHGVDWGFGPPLQHVGDTRWKGVREAREIAAQAFREVVKAKPARRKAAAQKAAAAVSDVVREIRQPRPISAPVADGWTDVLASLESLQTILAGMADAERIKAAEARAAAEQWARIEAELRLDAFFEEEMMVVLALALS